MGGVLLVAWCALALTHAQHSVPPDWQPRIAQAQMLATDEIPFDGLFPAIGNGFIAGDVGCSNVTNLTSSGGSCGRLYMGGVFNQRSGYPNRAVIPNPFSAFVWSGKKDGSGPVSRLGAGLDLENAIFLNRSLVACVGQQSASQESKFLATIYVQVETSIYAHQLHRQLLVFNISLIDQLPMNQTCTVHFSSCTATTSDFTISHVNPQSSAYSALKLTVNEMESPPQGGTVPKPPNTIVGVAYQPIPNNITFSSASPTHTFLAVFRTTLEPALSKSNPCTVAISDLAEFSSPDVLPTLLPDHMQAVQTNIWTSGIEIGGNSTVAGTVNSSLYYILTAIREDWPYGTSPGGLARDDYSGHSFWDTETWMFPVIALLFPKQAQSLMQYRSQRLAAAKDQAKAEGAMGAKWPWESALLGYGVSPWLKGDINEIHITGDIPLAMQLLWRLTKNDTWLETDVWEVASSSADYFASRMVPVVVLQSDLSHSSRKMSPQKAALIPRVLDTSVEEEPATSKLHGSDRTITVNYTLLQVVGADEKAGIQDDSVFTNAVAALACKFAIDIAQRFNKTLNPLWVKFANSPYIPLSVLPNSSVVGHPEYTGYSGQDINQADVALLQYPLQIPMPLKVAINDLLYYQQRSSTVKTAGFFTGDSAYAIAWARLGNTSAAMEQFINAFAHMDMAHFNVWMEKSFDGGGNLNFLTGSGGYLQNWIYGYAGIQIVDSGIQFVNSSLPQSFNVTSVKLRGIGFAGARFDMYYDSETISFELASESSNHDLVVVDQKGKSHAIGFGAVGRVVLDLQSVLVSDDANLEPYRLQQ